jgi:hypothetical protein
MLLEVVDVGFPKMIFVKSDTESISFDIEYEFLGHPQLEHLFSNEIYASFRNYLRDDIYKRYNRRYTYFSTTCYFIIENESYKIGIDFDF